MFADNGVMHDDDQPGQVLPGPRLVSGRDGESLFSAICFLESSGLGGFTSSAIPLW
jgi:hypothetical protein